MRLGFKSEEKTLTNWVVKKLWYIRNVELVDGQEKHE